MPRVNSRFATCPDCKNNTRFKKKTYVVFLYDDEAPDGVGMVYQEEVHYECTRCGYVVKKVTTSG